jgi:hypothetical protein
MISCQCYENIHIQVNTRWLDLNAKIKPVSMGIFIKNSIENSILFIINTVASLLSDSRNDDETPVDGSPDPIMDEHVL